MLQENHNQQFPSSISMVMHTSKWWRSVETRKVLSQEDNWLDISCHTIFWVKGYGTQVVLNIFPLNCTIDNWSTQTFISAPTIQVTNVRTDQSCVSDCYRRGGHYCLTGNYGILHTVARLLEYSICGLYGGPIWRALLPPICQQSLSMPLNPWMMDDDFDLCHHTMFVIRLICKSEKKLKNQ